MACFYCNSENEQEEEEEEEEEVVEKGSVFCCAGWDGGAKFKLSLPWGGGEEKEGGKEGWQRISKAEKKKRNEWNDRMGRRREIPSSSLTCFLSFSFAFRSRDLRPAIPPSLPHSCQQTPYSMPRPPKCYTKCFFNSLSYLYSYRLYLISPSPPRFF